MTPAGVGKILPGDSKTAFSILFRCTSFRDSLPSIAQGAKGPTQQNHSRPGFSDHIFQAAPVCKSEITDRRKVVTTPLAARLSELDVYSDEPLLETNKCPPFRKISAPGTLGLSFANEACHCYRTIILKKLAAPRFLGKDFKEANHKTIWEPIE